MRTLREAKLTPASVRNTATFREAADALCEAGVSALAVLGEDERVLGLFTDDDLVAGLFPRYLKELRHTAFAEDMDDVLADRVARVSPEPVTRHMRAPVTVEVDASATHAAERFLHVPWGAIAVVERGRFVGMLTEVALARSLLDPLLHS
ncbi:MAG: CBS domain-containing protein [Thermoleophilia bacterium]|nr:CBS domain-containing protein [Thermoleophilia bacterium]